MGSEDRALEDVVAKLKLDVKALTLLYESDDELRPVLERRLVESEEEHVKRFMSLIQPRRKEAKEGGIPVAVGEIVLASFLTIVGLGAFVPVLAGLSTPKDWVAYVSSLPSSATSPLSAWVPLLDFAFSALLLLGAFYTLRRASSNLSRAGMAEPGRA